MTGYAVSWAFSDQERPISPKVAACNHVPGMWRRDLSFPGLPIPARFVTECRVCGVTMKAKGTEFGTITRLLDAHPRA